MKQINTVATLAANLTKKPSKKEVWKVILDCMDRGLPDHLLVDLYSYFMPSPGAKPKTAQEWVAKAMAKKDVRKYLNLIYSDGKMLMATDGHRLHIAPLSYPEGFYGAAMNLVDGDGMTYPDVDRVIPSRDGDQFEIPESPRALPYPAGTGATAVELVTGCWVDLKYWEQAIKGREDLVCGIAWAGAAAAPVRIDYADDSVAVIMPIRMDEEEE